MTDPRDDRRSDDEHDREHHRDEHDRDDTGVPAEVQSVDEGLPNDKIPDDETIIRDTEAD
ncbi:hypothetical protein [Agromyces salentinus]|uniref:Multidrug transporter n=1 Tax=Agromyces salentinus TaxID=269421 RepID=A0ABN2MKC8_9MICO|nr:hypothetical protein [Agromyces salentinus]